MSDTSLTGNKGEWSEVYVLLKLLADREVFFGDADEEGDADVTSVSGRNIPIRAVQRSGNEPRFTFTDPNDDLGSIQADGQVLGGITSSTMCDSAQDLLQTLKDMKGSSFAIPRLDDLLLELGITSLKASSQHKSDLFLTLYDPATRQISDMGFSVKSQLGSRSSLLNASLVTNLSYRVTGVDLSDSQVESLNSLDNIFDGFEALSELGGDVVFDDIDNACFRNNLLVIDSRLPDILAEMVLLYYREKIIKLKDLIEEQKRRNALGFDLSLGHPFYGYKVKQFLIDVALGMKPASVWKGHHDATGGYLVVRPDGSLLCHHLNQRNVFGTYLCNSTVFDTPSRRRHRFGSFYRQHGLVKIDLNLGIRFTK